MNCDYVCLHVCCKFDLTKNMRNTATIGVQAFTKAKAMFTSFVLYRYWYNAINESVVNFVNVGNKKAKQEK